MSDPLAAYQDCANELECVKQDRDEWARRCRETEAERDKLREVIVELREALVHADAHLFSAMQCDYTGELDRMDYPGVFGPIQRALALKENPCVTAGNP